MKKLALLISVTIFLNSVHAQWQSNGPEGQIVSSLAVGDSVIFAGTYFAGVYISTDNGLSWTPIDSGLTTSYIYALTISGSYIFAATDDGVFLSTNNGAYWTTSLNSLTNIRVNSLAITGNNIFGGTVDYGVYLSTDNGTTWMAVNSGLPGTVYVNSLAIEGANIFATTNSSGTFLSTNNGGHWMVDGLTNLDVLTLAVNNTNVFAGIYGSATGVFLSTDTGANWMALDSSPVNVTSFAIQGSNIFAGTFGNGVYLSTNNGTNWTSLGLSTYIITSLAVNDSFIFAGAYDSVWRRPLGDFGCNLSSPVITAGDTAFCPGDTVQICAPGGFTSYQWSATGTGSCLNVNQPGNYYVMVTDNTGCTAASNHISITVYPAPSVPITAEGDTVFCASDSVQLCSPTGFVSYQWNAGATGSCFEAKQAGDYYVSVTDNNGCTYQSGHIAVSVYPVPSVSIIVQGDTLSSFGSVKYQWYLNDQPLGNDTGPVCVAGQPGLYKVAVTDTNGCMATSSVVAVTGVSALAEYNRVLIYPNPSTNNWQLRVKNELIGSSLEVYDAEGRIVFQSEIHNSKSEIDLNVSKGVYWLRVSNERVSIITKLVKL